MRFFLPTAILGVALVTAAPAYATPISVDNAVFSGALCASDFGTCPAADILSAPGTVTLGGSSLTYALTPSPFITAFVTGGNSTGIGDSVAAFGNMPSGWDTPLTPTAILRYYAHFGGTPNVPLPVDLAYKLSVWSTSPDSRGASAAIWLNQSGHALSIPGINYDELTYIDGAPGLMTPTRSGVLTDTILSGTEFDVTMDVIAVSDAIGSAYASVDPVLYIDPSFAAIDPNYLTDFPLELSPGVGNTPNDIPEPMTLPLFLAGLVGLFGAMRLRRPTMHQVARAPVSGFLWQRAR